MNTRDKAHRTLLKHVAQPEERSTLFWYLVEHHDELAGASGQARLRWNTLCEDFHALGLTDARGNPPTPVTARMTWLRARKELARVAREKVTGVPARKRQPRDLPRTTVPIVAAPSPLAPRPPASSPASGDQAKAPGGSIARLRQVMEGR